MTATDLVPVSDPGALEADPVEYMAVVLNRAKGWLAEASSIEAVRETKAIAVGYESVIREKELAFDAQLSATEIVRRCERRIGELLREGQRLGDIRRTGERGPGERDPQVPKASPATVAGVTDRSQVRPLYVMADAPPEDFERAVADARSEGNLSRANVVRKVKGAPLGRPVLDGRRAATATRNLWAALNTLDAVATSLPSMPVPSTAEPEEVDRMLAVTERAIASLRKLRNQLRGEA